MKTVNSIIQAVIGIAFLAGCAYFSNYLHNRAETMRTDELQEHTDIKAAIVRMDSLNRVGQQRIIDSLVLRLDATEGRIQGLESINAKLQKQNEKLDAIYRSVRVDMPEF